MLGSLRITQRLGLLVMLPLGALVVTSLPATVERADQARAAASILHAATSAQVVGSVVGDLQRERLLALSFVGSARARRSVLVSQAGSTAAAATYARGRLGGAGTELLAALDAIDGLGEVRQRVLARGISAAEVYRRYTDSIDAVVTALRLGGERAADAPGLRQMASLDALLRLNEEAAKVGAALVLSSVDPAYARSVIAVATPLALVHQRNLERSADEATLTVAGRLANTSVAKRTETLVAATLTGPASAAAALEESLAVAEDGLRVRRVVGERVAADVATQATARADRSRNAAAAVAAVGIGLTVILIWLGVAISRSVARPLRRITLAATAVADLAAREMVRVADADSPDQGPPRLAAVTLRTADEVGELASAFNRVQATAALLMEQQVTTRRNVAVMFGNIANRTRSLVARQLADIDELERDERDDERLARLYHLDHLTTRLRRSSDSLLVIAGANQEQMATPTPLPEIVRAAISQVEGFQSVRLGAVCDVVVAAAAVSDLTLLLAELVENATAFSPPGTTVDVTATLADVVVISIVDRGVGMTPERLEAENRRLVSRERLDLVPTAMLGFVVAGRIARRHGLVVRLLPTPVSGVTAEVILPASSLLGAAPPSGAPRPVVHAIESAARVTAIGSASVPRPSELGPHSFGWFHQDADAPDDDYAVGRHHRHPSPTDRTFNGSNSDAHIGAAQPLARDVPDRDMPARNGLRKRRRGEAISPTDLAPGRPPAGVPRPRDPRAEQAQVNAFAEGTSRGAAHGHDPRWDARDRSDAAGSMPPPRSEPQSRGGLQRRRPLEHLAATMGQDISELRLARPSDPTQRATPRMRDAAAERAQLSGYLDGLARAEATAPSHHDTIGGSQ